MTARHVKKVLIVELNEFNSTLLSKAVEQYAFPTLSKILQMPRSNYQTQDRYESGFLEPWVQWVSIHTGKPSNIHQIKHLGDVPHLGLKQCWEVLSEHAVTTGVWGAMNASRNKAANTCFFLPDPWTFSEHAAPSSLNQLLELPRYLAKNYQNINTISMIGKGLKLFKFIATSGIANQMMSTLPKLFSPLKQFGKKHFIFISFFEYVSTLLFIQYKKKYNPDCCFLFLNSLAHLQHHYWYKGTETITPEILFGLTFLEKGLSALLSAFPSDAVVIHNGLSQMNTNHEKPWVLYRQKDPDHFYRALGIPFTRIEQLMTHDGDLFFQCPKACNDAYLALKNARIQGMPLFHVEINPCDSLKLFCQLVFTDPLDDKNIHFTFNDKQYAFFDYFDNIVTRTGRHVPVGTLYSDTILFPQSMYNHDFNTYLYRYLLPNPFPLKAQNESHYHSCIPA